MDCIIHGVAKSWTQVSDFHLELLGLRIPYQKKNKKKGNFIDIFISALLTG